MDILNFGLDSHVWGYEKEMVEHDLIAVRRDDLYRTHGFDVCDHHE